MERVWVEWNGAVHTRLHSTIVCLVRPTCTCRSDITTGWLLPNCNSEHAIRTRIRHDENNRAWVQQKQVGSVRCCARYQQAGGRKGNATNDTLCRLISFTRHLNNRCSARDGAGPVLIDFRRIAAHSSFDKRLGGKARRLPPGVPPSSALKVSHRHLPNRKALLSHGRRTPRWRMRRR